MKRRRLHTVLLVVLWIGFLGLFQNCAPVKDLNQDEQVIKDLEVAIEKTENQLLTLAESDRSCARDTDCLAIPLGFKGCGGPRSHTHTSASNDLPTLEALSASLHDLERDYWNRGNRVDTCELRLPPTLACQSGLCQVVTQYPQYVWPN